MGAERSPAARGVVESGLGQAFQRWRRRAYLSRRAGPTARRRGRAEFRLALGVAMTIENPGDEGCIRVERRGALMLIGIHHRAKRNSFTPQMFDQLSAASSVSRTRATHASRCCMPSAIISAPAFSSICSKCSCAQANRLRRKPVSIRFNCARDIARSLASRRCKGSATLWLSS